MGGDIEEYPFIFMNTPASLQILASVEMALIVWRCKYANTSHLFERPSSCFMKRQFSCKEVLVVRIPNRIQAQINEKIVDIGRELREWVGFHSDQDFLDADSTETFRKCFKHIAVDFSGSIGGKASAINMLNSGEFSYDVVNYKIACLYCLEDEVKRFWPSEANESRIDVNSHHDQCCLSYWNGWMKSGGNSITDTGLVKTLMKNAADWRNDAGFDYFSKMLPDHERVSEFISILCDHDWNHPAVVHSLSLRIMGRVQAEEVFKERASSIFIALTISDTNFRYAHHLWTLMGHLILENKLEFCNVVYKLWICVYLPDHDDGLNYTQYGQINNLLLEIWSHASEELKAYVSNTLRDELLNYSPGPIGVVWPACLYGHDMTFLLEIMSKLRDLDKDRWWRKNWRELALRSKPLYLEQFMRMCLPNDHDIEHFKIKIANIKDIFRSLIEEGFYSDLKDYVKFCSNDEKQCQQLAKKVLQSNLDVIFLHDDEKFAEFEWFVSGVFANVQKDAEEFKTQMISSAECLMYLLDTRQTDEISWNDFIRSIIRRFVNNEVEWQRVKRELFEHCRTYPIDYQCMEKTFNADRWQKFLEWCTDDHEEIAIFKRSLNADVIFKNRLREYLSLDSWYSTRLMSILRFLDGFLKWHCGNEEDAKKFKLDKIKNYKQIDILRVEIEKIFIKNDGAMYKLLMWFFDNNVENVFEFCKTNLIILSSSRK